MRAPLDLDDTDDFDFVQYLKPIVAGVVRIIEPPELYVVKLDSWFGDKWLGFSHKVLGALSLHSRTLRVPPFVPARVVSQRFLRRSHDGEYVADAMRPLHIRQSSEDNARRLMSTVCPNATVVWWSGGTRVNKRGCLMAYLPTPEGHTGWYAEFKKRDTWMVANTLRTTAEELSTYAAA